LLIKNTFLENLNQIVWQYNLLVSEILNFRKNLLEAYFNKSIRVTQKNIPHVITKLQRLFIESPSILLLSIIETKNNTKKLKSNVKFYNPSLVDVLLKKILIKTIQKNYKAQAIKRVWINKKNSFEVKPLEIYTLRDCILQKIIWLAIFPIAEFQSDVYSFAYRPLKSALMCTSILYKCCVQTQKFPRNKYFPIWVNKKTFKKYPPKYRTSLRTKFNTFGKNPKKRRKLYKKKLYILKILKQKSKSVLSRKTSEFNKCLTVWNFTIQNCFDKINHQTIIQLTPLCDKYLFFLKQWLIAPIIGPVKKDSKTMIFVKPKIGISQSGIIGPGICNLVLDGIDDLLLKLKRNNKLFLKHTLNNKVKSSWSRVFSSMRISKKHYLPKIEITYLRYANDIIFYGYHNKKIFSKIKKEITRFLTKRGFTIKSLNNIFQFKPKSAFLFLGHKYISPSKFRKQKLNNGRFTKKKYTLLNIVKNRFATNLRSRIFVTISPNAYKRFKYSIRKIFKKGHFYMSVAQVISILNKKMKSFVYSFLNTDKIRIQFNSLDNSIRKWFWKWLKKKYSSKPKLLTFLYEKFLNGNNFFTAEKKILIPLRIINVNNQQLFLKMLLLKAPFKKNIFLNIEAYDQFKLFQNMSSALNFFLRNKKLTKK
jgi:hypothetical protein